MIIGFTGTQEGMTPQQKQWFDTHLGFFKCKEFKHGDCFGADSEAHDIALKHVSKIVIHPPNYDSKRAFCNKRTKEGIEIQIMPEKWYIDRNHDIVDGSEMMIATPKEYSEQLRSGTWATIRYAKKSKKPLMIIYPDGTFKTSHMDKGQ
jgi:hypothetical protein